DEASFQGLSLLPRWQKIQQQSAIEGRTAATAEGATEWPRQQQQLQQQQQQQQQHSHSTLSDSPRVLLKSPLSLPCP
ncbi:hypothetical protein ETH_00011510, partial [Eimeria tenella]